MNKKQKIKLGITLSLTPLPFLSLIALTSCSNIGYCFGNFESYMAPTVIKAINKSINNINWQYYSSNFQIPTYLQNKTLNAAITTNNMAVVLAKKNLINKVDYSQFELINDKGEIIDTTDKFTDYLLTDSTRTICKNGFIQFGIDNLSEYGIPYFLQNFVFCYRGEEIKSLHQPNVSYIDILKELSTNQNFKNKRIALVDDPRTLYGVSEIINDINNNPNDININPNKGLYGDSRSNTPSIEQFTSIYGSFNSLLQEAKKQNGVKINLNSDSNIIINKLAKKEIQGAFLYNGDAIYSALGGDYGINIESSDFHVVVPSSTINALDLIVFNKNNSIDEQNAMMKLAYNITLAGSKTKGYNNINTPICETLPSDSSSLDITSKNSNGDYNYLPMQNFDYVNYTPTLNSIYYYVLNSYFEGPMASELSKLIDITLNPNTVSHFIEMPLNDLANSNLRYAYLTFKEKL